MRVVEIPTQDQQRRYVVIDAAGVLVEPIVRYLKYLDHIGSARHTLRSYAFALKLYWEYVTEQHLDWQHVSLDDLAQFVLWLKLPTGSLHVLPIHPVPQATVNGKAALSQARLSRLPPVCLLLTSRPSPACLPDSSRPHSIRCTQ